MLLIYLLFSCHLNGSINHCLLGGIHRGGASSLTKIWIRCCCSLSLTLSVSFCLSSSVPAVVLQIQFIFDEALRFWAAVVIPAGNIRRPSLALSISLFLSVLVSRHRHTHTHTHKIGAAATKQNPQLNQKLFPLFQSEFLFIFHCVHCGLLPAYVWVCICVCVWGICEQICACCL